ncbi:hypothetical protein TRVL_09504 [Trypanosoma vivax]|nr:hypothetical protein TRVL_09504 [Trypanosoma vivax]
MHIWHLIYEEASPSQISSLFLHLHWSHSFHALVGVSRIDAFTIPLFNELQPRMRLQGKFWPTAGLHTKLIFSTSHANLLLSDFAMPSQHSLRTRSSHNGTCPHFPPIQWSQKTSFHRVVKGHRCARDHLLLDTTAYFSMLRWQCKAANLFPTPEPGLSHNLLHIR